MEQNINIWDFTLSEDDIKEISKLNIDHSKIVNHYDANFVKMIHNLKIHK